jgi:hypothetical protein
MGGKGELVKYTREYKKAPLSDEEKQDLIDTINGIVEEATQTITVIVLVEDKKKP